MPNRATIDIRKGQVAKPIARTGFHALFNVCFYDPAYDVGGNLEPTTTHGKHVNEAKLIEQPGCDYSKHLVGRAYGVVVHGDLAGVESHRRNVVDWLE